MEAKMADEMALRHLIGQISKQLQGSWMQGGKPAQWNLSMFDDTDQDIVLECSRKSQGHLTFRAGSIQKVITYHQYNFQTQAWNIYHQLKLAAK
jgi:hypothetical protein